MTTHAAVVTTRVRGPLEVHRIETPQPEADEVQVRVEWTSSTPLNLHQNDGGLLVHHPHILSGNTAGTVIKAGPAVKHLRIGDKVFGYTWRYQKERSHQEICVCPEYLLSKIPTNLSPQEVVTTGDSLVTVFHAVTTDLSLPLPWPVPSTPPEHANTPLLIWGGSSSVGQYALQVLKHWGYKNLYATSSPQHHSLLRSLGAAQAFDYRSPQIVAQITESAGGKVPLVLDCIGSKHGSLAPISKLVSEGSKVAILLPVIVKDASSTEAPEYSMDVATGAEWTMGVDARGVRTHFYLEKNEFFKMHLQTEIIPTLLSKGIVKPTKYRVVEDESLLKRAQTALDILRVKGVSGERLVWRVAE